MSFPEPTMCRGAVIVHDDRTLTCSETACTSHGFDPRLAVHLHGMFASCHTVFPAGNCPLCQGPGEHAGPQPQR
jgi:hypothetical protein